jgi:hypothetical protein
MIFRDIGLSFLVKKMREIAVFLALGLLPCIAFAQSSALISGKVVDRDGPVFGAVVSLVSSCENCPDELIPTVTTTDDGYFSMEGDFAHAKDTRIFVEKKAPKEFWTPFFAPDFFLTKLLRFRGIKVHVPSSGLVNLGEVAPTVDYAKITVDLSKAFATRNSLGIRSKESLRLAVYRGDLKVIGEISIPENALSGMLVKLALPIGENWTLKISFLDGSRSVMAKVFVNLDHADEVVYQNE